VKTALRTAASAAEPHTYRAGGMFVAKNAPFTTAWTAAQPMGTLVGERVYRGGVVQNRVTVLVIVMVEPE
jgi:hypothetical protein